MNPNQIDPNSSSPIPPKPNNYQPQVIRPSAPQNSNDQPSLIPNRPIQNIQQLYGQNSNTTGVNQPAASEPKIYVNGSAQAVNPNIADPIPPKSKKKKLLLPLAIVFSALFIFGGGSAAVYFGYLMNPKVIWSQSINNVNTAYQKFVDYTSLQSKVHYKGSSITGNLSVSSNQQHYSGNVVAYTNGSNFSGDLKANIGVATLGFKLKSIITNPNKAPDLYIYVSGYKNLGLANLLGLPNNNINKLDGQWIQIDHSILQKIEQYSTLTSGVDKSGSKLNSQIIESALAAFGKTNQKYVFTNSSNSITKIIKNVGFETIDGVKTYHYIVGFNKSNVKSYYRELSSSLQSSQFGSWLQKNTGLTVSQTFGLSDLESSANNISSKDTLNVWMNVNKRIIYKVRAYDTSSQAKTDKAITYIEIGLSKITNNNYPLFLNFSSKSSLDNTTTGLILNINTHTNVISLNINSKENSDELTGKLQYQPTANPQVITAPTGSMTLEQAMTDLGFSKQYNDFIKELNNPPPINPNQANPFQQNIFQSI